MRGPAAVRTRTRHTAAARRSGLGSTWADYFDSVAAAASPEPAASTASTTNTASVSTGTPPSTGTATPAPVAGCPDYAPFRSRNGGCSNVQEIFSSAPAAGTIADPFTGAVMPVSPIVEQVRAQVGVFQDMAQQQAIAAEAERQGAARGIPTSCDVVRSDSPVDHGAFVLQTLCQVANSPDLQAGNLLIQPGGWQIFATAYNQQRPAGSPPVSTPGLLTTAGGYGSGVTPVASSPSPSSPAPSPSSNTGTTPAGTPAAAAGESILDRLRAVPSEVWLGAGLAVIGLLIYGMSKGGRR